MRAVTVSVDRTQSLRLDNYLRVIARLMSPEPEGLVWVPFFFFLILKGKKKKPNPLEMPNSCELEKDQLLKIREPVW